MLRAGAGKRRRMRLSTEQHSPVLAPPSGLRLTEVARGYAAWSAVRIVVVFLDAHKSTSTRCKGAAATARTSSGRSSPQSSVGRTPRVWVKHTH